MPSEGFGMKMKNSLKIKHSRNLCGGGKNGNLGVVGGKGVNLQSLGPEAS